MPGLFYSPISRKGFLQSTGAALGSLAMTSLLPAQQSERDSSNAAHLALLSDTHIPEDPTNEYRGFRPVANLKKVAEQVAARRPQAAIINGDAARLTGEKGDYRALRLLLKPIAQSTPVHIGLGNHDHRTNFFSVFESQNPSPVVQKHVSVFGLGGTQFVVLDSLLYVDKVAGLLGKAQRDWLSKFLETSPDQPTVFFVHHTLGDGDGDLLDFDRVFEILKPHRKVKAIFYGHSHRYHVDQRDHIHLINQPAIGYNFNDSQPVGWLDAQFTAEGVSLRLNAIGGNTAGDGKTTTVAWS